MSDSVALREGLYRETSEGPVLMGGKCTACGAISFPRATSFCLECGGHDVESVDLGRDGTLFCETTVHMKTERFAAGYAVGYVTMSHGVRVFGQLLKNGQKPLCIGQGMRVEIAPMWSEGDRQVACYRFRPADEDFGGTA